MVLIVSSVGLLSGGLAFADGDNGNTIGNEAAGLDEATCKGVVSGQMGVVQSYYDLIGYRVMCQNYLNQKKQHNKHK